MPAKPVAADATQVDALHSVDAYDAITKEEPLGRDETIRRATTRNQQLAASLEEDDSELQAQIEADLAAFSQKQQRHGK